jgi:hypothetical protein
MTAASGSPLDADLASVPFRKGQIPFSSIDTSLLKNFSLLREATAGLAPGRSSGRVRAIGEMRRGPAGSPPKSGKLLSRQDFCPSGPCGGRLAPELQCTCGVRGTVYAPWSYSSPRTLLGGRGSHLGAGWRRAQRLTGKEHAPSAVGSTPELPIDSGARSALTAAAEAGPASEPPQGIYALSPRIHVRGIALQLFPITSAGRQAALASCAVPGDSTGLK